MSTQYMGPDWPGQPSVRLLLLLLLVLTPPAALLLLLLLLPGPTQPLKLLGSAASRLCMMTVPSDAALTSQGSSSARPLTPELWCHSTRLASFMRRSCAISRPSAPPENSRRPLWVPSRQETLPS